MRARRLPYCGVMAAARSAVTDRGEVRDGTLITVCTAQTLDDKWQGQQHRVIDTHTHTHTDTTWTTALSHRHTHTHTHTDTTWTTALSHRHTHTHSIHMERGN